MDTLGLLLLVKILPANTAETKAAMSGLERAHEVLSEVQLAGRSPVNFVVNLIWGLIAYCHQPMKPSLGVMTNELA